jgi:hypothetical protein
MPCIALMSFPRHVPCSSIDVRRFPPCAPSFSIDMRSFPPCSPSPYIDMMSFPPWEPRSYMDMMSFPPWAPRSYVDIRRLPHNTPNDRDTAHVAPRMPHLRIREVIDDTAASVAAKANTLDLDVVDSRVRVTGTGCVRAGIKGDRYRLGLRSAHRSSCFGLGLSFE